MLTNKAKLGVKTTSGAATYTNLPGLKEIPDIGMSPEKVDNTCLTDTIMQYELGIGDPGDMGFRFKLVNSAATDSYRILRGLETAGSTNSYQLELADGTTYTFDAQVAIQVNGGGVNTALDFTANLALQSAITVGNPSGQSGN